MQFCGIHSCEPTLYGMVLCNCVQSIVVNVALDVRFAKNLQRDPGSCHSLQLYFPGGFWSDDLLPPSVGRADKKSFYHESFPRSHAFFTCESLLL